VSVVVGTCLGMLALAAALALLRVVKGPTMLDRVVALDIIVAVVVIALCLEAAVDRHATTLPAIVVLSLVGFLGAVSIARYAAREEES
jgi:multicomponent Na+:H+ antiporter subunit F